MPEPPRRARFQIHLSTAIVLMFVAGGLIWANVTPSVFEFGGTIIEKKGYLDFKGDIVRRSVFGWPWIAYEVRTEYQYYYTDPRYPEVRFDPSKKWNEKSIFCDIALALAILFAVWFLLEYLIRRRAARKMG